MERLATLGRAEVVHGSTDPTGFDAVINATPMGMNANDPDPVDVSRLTPAMWVGCVITQPVVSPLVAAARALGCQTLTGAEMFAQVRDLMVDFLLEGNRR
jgi:shikimate dehydrogenase